MGQCGCGDGFGHYKLRAADGWFVLTLYPGCHDCDTPAGIMVSFYSDSDESMLSNIADLPDLTAKLRDSEMLGIFLEVFNFHILANHESLEEIAEPSEYATVKDLVSDMHYQVVQATIDTINKTLKQTKN